MMSRGLGDVYKRQITVWAAEPSLRAWADVGVGGSVVEVTKIDRPKPGSSGVQLRLHFYEMIEGFREGRTVRIALRSWDIPERPREEKLNPNDSRIFEVGPEGVTGRVGPPPR